MALKIVIQEMPEIITIGKIIKIVEDEDESLPEGLDAGLYAFDSVGQVWQLHTVSTELFAAFDVADRQLQKDRVEARERLKSKLKKGRKKV